MTKQKPKPMTFAQATTDTSFDASEYWQRVTELSGLPRPTTSSDWAVLLQRAGFSDSLIERSLTTLGFRGFEDAGELSRGYVAGNGDSRPIFSARLFDGLERYHESRGESPKKTKASRVQPDHKVTVWMKTNLHKYANATEAIKAYSEIHGGNPKTLYQNYNNDKRKKAPESRSKKRG